jgi:hypothetical protein
MIEISEDSTAALNALLNSHSLSLAMGPSVANGHLPSNHIDRSRRARLTWIVRGDDHVAIDHVRGSLALEDADDGDADILGPSFMPVPLRFPTVVAQMVGS